MTSIQLTMERNLAAELLSPGNLVTNRIRFNVRTRHRMLLENTFKFVNIKELYLAPAYVLSDRVLRTLGSPDAEWQVEATKCDFPIGTPMVSLGAGKLICSSLTFNCFWIDGELIFYLHDPATYASKNVLDRFELVLNYNATNKETVTRY